MAERNVWPCSLLDVFFLILSCAHQVLTRWCLGPHIGASQEDGHDAAHSATLDASYTLPGLHSPSAERLHRQPRGAEAAGIVGERRLGHLSM